MVDLTKIPPLDWQFPIVDPDTGRPSPQFIRLWQQMFGNTETVGDVLGNNIIAGLGLDGGGSLENGSVTLDANVQDILDVITTTQGSLLYRNASDWVALAPGTLGQVLQSGGAAANPSWTSSSGGGVYTDKQSLNGLATISFTVPAGYSTLRLIINGRTQQAALQDNPFVRVNGLSTAIYSTQRQYVFNTTATNDQALNETSLGTRLAGLPGTTAPANAAGFNDIQIFDYANTTFRKVGHFTGRQPFSTGANDGYLMKGTFEINATAAITSISVTTTSGSNFTNGSTAELILIP